MRWIICTTFVSVAACCGPATSFDAPDLSASQYAACPSGAEAVMGARCSYGQDSGCQSPFGYVCRCVCTGYWECDQVKVVCDPDGGAPGD